MNFGMIILNQGIKTMDIDSFIINIRLKIFTKILQMMLKKDLTHQTMNAKTIAYRKNRRVIGLMKDE